MPKGYHHLTYAQRSQITILKASGDSPTKIARALNVHHTTISRELKRNFDNEAYHYEKAQAKSTLRRASRANKKMQSEIATTVKQKLKLQWSPVQISGFLKRHKIAFISHETIYKYIWKDKAQGGELYKDLRHHGKKYTKRSHALAGRGCIIARVDIDQRPTIVDEKARLGDWELDTIIGVQGGDVLVSMVERASKLTRLVKVDGKTATAVSDALINTLGPMQAFVYTLTADNGSEFAYHQKVSRRLDAEFYFAKPYHSWQRGLNEHTNGLIRQYFPKKTDFSKISDEEVKQVEILLNNRPRKVLDYETPIERFEKLSRGIVHSKRVRGYLNKSVYSTCALRP
jgi:IS30 family transposase